MICNHGVEESRMWTYMLDKLIVIRHNLITRHWQHQECALFQLIDKSFVTFFDLSYWLEWKAHRENFNAHLTLVLKFKT